jgi:hypothetical protein
MKVELPANKLSESVREGFLRVKRFRLARESHIQSYVGDYFSREVGITGERPLNLVFLAIRSLVPNVVQKEGISKVLTPILAQREYAEKLGLALDELHRKTKRAKLLRSCVVDMCFGPAITKTGIAASRHLLQVGDLTIDPGQLFTERISLDDFVCDPQCLDFSKAAFLGHRVRIERAKLLNADGWNQDLVRRLPRAGSKAQDGIAADLSKDDGQSTSMLDFQDYVNVIELYVPEAEAICYLPDPEESGATDFLKIEEYYGPPSGPYTFGALTQPVPDNPFPIAPVGVWRDLSDMACTLFKKAMKQADRQKNVTLYRPSCADTAEAVFDAKDGEAIPTEDPDGVQVRSYEGPSPETVSMAQNIYGYFNLMAGNPDLMSGAAINADKATGQQILQQNAGIAVGDMRDMTYEFGAEISSKEAWYLHNDDLMFQPGQPGFPLIKQTANGDERQEFLTPQDRTGEFDTLGFTIVKRSMSVIDPQTRVQLLQNFAANVMPQAAMVAQVSMQIGQEFNLRRYITAIAEDMGIAEIIDGIFSDPEWQSRMEWYASTVGKENKKLGGQDTMQNGGFPIGRAPAMDPMQQFNQQAQAGAAGAQAGLPVRQGGGLPFGGLV